jgi:hypothetical protein
MIERAGTRPRRGVRVRELIGAAPITPRDQARTIADALGEPIRFAEQTR